MKRKAVEGAEEADPKRPRPDVLQATPSAPQSGAAPRPSGMHPSWEYCLAGVQWHEGGGVIFWHMPSM